MRISQKTSVCRHCGTRMGSLVAIEKPGWRILHLTLLNLHNWFNMIIDFIIKIIISANQEILDTWCRAIESRKESAFLWLTSHTFQFFSLCSGWIWFVISATCALLLFVIFSTARCSSSRNSLKGIHPSIHPSSRHFAQRRCYLQLWWYFCKRKVRQRQFCILAAKNSRGHDLHKYQKGQCAQNWSVVVSFIPIFYINSTYFFGPTLAPGNIW